VLGHALSMQAIHGGKAKNDKIDAHTLLGAPNGKVYAPPGSEYTDLQTSITYKKGNSFDDHHWVP
jgi:hypothetical protein